MANNGDCLSSNKLLHCLRIKILFASQTGQAESISQLIYERNVHLFQNYLQLETDLLNTIIQRHCISKFESIIDQFFIPNLNEKEQNWTFLLIIVASTTGQGDPPDTALKFVRWIRKLKRELNKTVETKNRKTFEHLSYALLGLGDTNYDNFANFAKQLNAFFSDLGAVKYVDPGKIFPFNFINLFSFPKKILIAFADDAVGLELVTEPFIENLLKTIQEQFCAQSIVSDAELNNNKFETKKINLTELNDCVDASIETNQSNLIDEPPMTKMNIDQPVVSSCVALTSSDKCHLSDICRQLIEPSSHLAIIPLEELVLPKYSAKLQNMHDSYVYTERNLKLIEEKRPTNQNDLLKKMTIKEYLQNKIPNNTPLHTGDVILTNILCKNLNY